MYKTVDEVKEALREKGYSGVKDEIYEAVEKLLPLYKEETIIDICKTLVAKYYDEHLEEVFGETMVVTEAKAINYDQTLENTHTRSQSIRVKTDRVLGSTKRTVKDPNKNTGEKASNARDPLDENIYKKRVAVYISHLREHAKWFLGAAAVEALIKTYATQYTDKYNQAFGTSFALHYTAPKKDWETWYLSQQLAD